jgi:putative copper export protein
VIQTLRLHGNPGSLVTSTHGLLLLGKVVLVGLMIRLAARNRRVLQRHRVAAIPNDDRAKTILLRTTTTEVLLGCAVIALTAILVAVTPG